MVLSITTTTHSFLNWSNNFNNDSKGESVSIVKKYAPQAAITLGAVVGGCALAFVASPLLFQITKTKLINSLAMVGTNALGGLIGQEGVMAGLSHFLGMNEYKTAVWSFGESSKMDEKEELVSYYLGQWAESALRSGAIGFAGQGVGFLAKAMGGSGYTVLAALGGVLKYVTGKLDWSSGVASTLKGLALHTIPVEYSEELTEWGFDGLGEIVGIGCLGTAFAILACTGGRNILTKEVLADPTRFRDALGILGRVVTTTRHSSSCAQIMAELQALLIHPSFAVGHAIANETLPQIIGNPETPWALRRRAFDILVCSFDKKDDFYQRASYGLGKLATDCRLSPKLLKEVWTIFSDLASSSEGQADLRLKNFLVGLREARFISQANNTRKARTIINNTLGLLEKVLKDNSAAPPLVMAAVDSLGSLEQSENHIIAERAINLLIDRGLTHPLPQVRGFAAKQLGETLIGVGPSLAKKRIQALFTLVNDVHPYPTKEALMAMGTITSRCFQLRYVSPHDHGARLNLLTNMALTLCHTIWTHPSQNVITYAAWVFDYLGGHIYQHGTTTKTLREIVMPDMSVDQYKKDPRSLVHSDLRQAIWEALKSPNTEILKLLWPFLGTDFIDLSSDGNTYSAIPKVVMSSHSWPLHTTHVAQSPDIRAVPCRRTPVPLATFLQSQYIDTRASAEVVGRTLCYYTPDGQMVALKPVPQDKRGRHREGQALMVVRNVGALKSQLPEPVLDEDGNIFTVVDSNGNELVPFKPPPGYYRSLDDSTLTETEFMEGLLAATHDVAKLAGEGLYHTVPTRMFHDEGALPQHRPQKDRGRYVCAPDFIQVGRFNRRGLGHLNDWQRALKHGNIGFTGWRDFEEIASLQEIIDNEWMPELKQMHSSYGEKSGYYCHTLILGNFLFAATLYIGQRISDEAKKKNAETQFWKSNKNLQPYADNLLQVYATFYSSLWGISFDDAKKIMAKRADWTRLARQMAFFMTKAHAPYVRPGANPANFPTELIFGKDAIVNGFGPYRPGSFDYTHGFVTQEDQQPGIGPDNGPLGITEFEKAMWGAFL